MLLTSLITALLVPFVLAAPSPTPDNPEPPTGYSSVYNTCSGTANLYCCNGQGAGDTGDLPTDAQTGCMRFLPSSRLGGFSLLSLLLE